MKKTIIGILSAMTAIPLGTLLYFAYRYMWFTATTIPPERVGVAMALSAISGVALGAYISLSETTN